MSVKTKTFVGTSSINTPAIDGTCTWTVKYNFPDITVSESSFTLPDMNVSGSYSWPNHTTRGGNGTADIYINLWWVHIGEKVPLVTEDLGYQWDFKPTTGTTGQFNKTVAYAPHRAINTADIFDSSNKTSKKLLVKSMYADARLTTYDTVTPHTSGGVTSYGSGTKYQLYASTYEMGYVTLNAPPTFTVGSITKDTNDYYEKATTVTVPISALSAKYGGDISSVKLTIGNQTATRTTNGNLSIKLSTAGTFTPIVTVTDSRGQVTTKSLSSIVVKPYVNPSINIISAIRADSAGRTDDEGAYGLARVKLSFLSDVANLTEPNVSLTDMDGNPVQATVDWYENWVNATGVSTKITDWSQFLTSPITVYALIDGSLDRTTSYVVSIGETDSQGQSATTMSQTITTAFYTIDFLAGGQGIAFGTASTQIGFLCALPFYLSLSTSDPSGTDHDLYAAITELEWENEVIV